MLQNRQRAGQRETIDLSARVVISSYGPKWLFNVSYAIILTFCPFQDILGQFFSKNVLILLSKNLEIKESDMRILSYYPYTT